MFAKLVNRGLVQGMVKTSLRTRVRLYSISHIRISTSNKRRFTPQVTNEDLLNRSVVNKDRIQEHRQEILNNEFPDLDIKKIYHPNATELESAHSLREVRTGLVPEKEKEEFEDYTMAHSIWTHEQLECVQQTHKKPTRVADYFAYGSVLFLRSAWDLSTGYLFGRRLKLFNFSHRMWLLRIVYLETAAGVPGMMFGMVRHLQSLRRMERDRGWIRCLLAEAENERIHLLTALHLYQPSKVLRYAILVTQGIMCNYLFLAYLISPRYGHSFVGYIEEQAVKTYTNLLKDIDEGKYPEFIEAAPALSKSYWKLGEDASWRDVFANMRADEVNHRDVNHGLADLVYDRKAVNPYRKVNINKE